MDYLRNENSRNGSRFSFGFRGNKHNDENENKNKNKNENTKTYGNFKGNYSETYNGSKGNSYNRSTYNYNSIYNYYNNNNPFGNAPSSTPSSPSSFSSSSSSSSSSSLPPPFPFSSSPHGSSVPVAYFDNSEVGKVVLISFLEVTSRLNLAHCLIVLMMYPYSPAFVEQMPRVHKIMYLVINFLYFNIFWILLYLLKRNRVDFRKSAYVTIYLTVLANLFLLLFMRQAIFVTASISNLTFIPLVSSTILGSRFGTRMAIQVSIMMCLILWFTYSVVIPDLNLMHLPLFGQSIPLMFLLQYIVSKYEEQLNISTQNARSASLAKSMFVAGMSHELRTPLHAILAAADFLQDLCTTEEQQVFVSTIKTCGKNLRAVVNNVLDLSQIESGKMELDKVAFDLLALAQEVADGVAGLADQKKIGLVLRVDPSIPLSNHHVWGDPSRLRQVLTNLLANAVKFTSKGLVEISLTKEEDDKKTSKETTKIKFQVADTGCGMEQDFLVRIFEPFAQASSTLTKGRDGSGLGLCIAHRFVEMMDGSIHVKSQKGKGSVFQFTVLFPVCSQEDLNMSTNHRELYQEHSQTCLHYLNTLMREYVMSFGLLTERSYIGRSVSESLRSWRFPVQEISSSFNYEYSLYRNMDVIIIDEDLTLLHYVYQKCIEELRRKESLKVPIILFFTTVSAYSTTSKVFPQSDANKLVYIITKPTGPIRLLQALCQIHEARLRIMKRQTVSPTALFLSNDKSFEKEHPTRKILIVEDNPINQMMLKHFLLKRTNTSCETVNSGKDAIIAWMNDNYDLVFMDIKIEGEMDGLETARIIRDLERKENRKRIIIVALTGMAMKEDREKAMQVGCDYFLTKPVDLKNLSRLLDQLL